MIVVADSAPLHYLILIDQVSLLPAFYDQVFIPEEVFRELSAVAAPGEVSEWLSNHPRWLHRAQVSEEELGPISDELDLGEREAVALAERLHADLLRVDDLAARTEAGRRNLRVTGTLGVPASPPSGGSLMFRRCWGVSAGPTFTSMRISCAPFSVPGFATERFENHSPKLRPWLLYDVQSRCGH